MIFYKQFRTIFINQDLFNDWSRCYLNIYQSCFLVTLGSRTMGPQYQQRKEATHDTQSKVVNPLDEFKSI